MRTELAVVARWVLNCMVGLPCTTCYQTTTTHYEVVEGEFDSGGCYHPGGRENRHATRADALAYANRRAMELYRDRRQVAIRRH